MENCRVEFLDHGTQVLTAPGAGFGTDALLLARFARPRQGQRAAELCSGCGIVSLVWHDMGYRGPCTAVELLPQASALCAAAVQANGSEAAHILPLCADLRTLGFGAESGSYDFAACNPPYFTGGPRSPDPARAAARHDENCTLPELAAAAGRLLHDGGRFVLCHKPEQLAAVCAALCAERLEPKRLALVKNRSGGLPWLFLLEAQKGRRPGLRWEPDVLVEGGAALYGPASKKTGPG
ncbi:MAG: tRNA1(Val) (adenine(37)-N6)-methyltransferase [Gemmiger sp.]